MSEDLLIKANSVLTVFMSFTDLCQFYWNSYKPLVQTFQWKNIFFNFYSFNNIFSLTMTAAAQKVMSLAKPLSQMKAIMGNKKKSFLHPDRLPFSPLFLSSNTLRGKQVLFNPHLALALPVTWCQALLMSQDPLEHPIYSGNVFLSNLLLPWLKWWPLVAGGVRTSIHGAQQPWNV